MFTLIVSKLGPVCDLDLMNPLVATGFPIALYKKQKQSLEQVPSGLIQFLSHLISHQTAVMISVD